MLSEEIRKSFLEFFKKKGHIVVPSSSLIPDDPSVLLTTAGMQQFKRYYTGELNPLSDFGSQRVTSIQKCFRTSDIDEVGDDSHDTFFEMLGNFSFGPVGPDNPLNNGEDGYFKKSAINWGFEFLNKELKIDSKRIKVSVFEGDDDVEFDKESYEIVKQLGFSEEQIIKGNRNDNFWGPTGNNGPCGPTVEFYVDDLEIWNLVFNEYFKDENGLRKLNNPGVDTGMGIERLAMVLQKVPTIFETDLFEPIISILSVELSSRAKRIIADHSRAIAFLLSDGVRPSNKEAGYVLRRLMRRVIVYENNLDLNIQELLRRIIDEYKNIYPELNEDVVISEFDIESKKFKSALIKGVGELKKLETIDAQQAFKLYESYGIPYEVIKEIGAEKAISLTREDFDEEFKKHQEISRAGAEKKFGGHGIISEEDEKTKVKLHTATHLLHWALREVLGKEVQQMGSDINLERLRFDFSFDRKLTAEELKQIEDLVNQKIKENLAVTFQEMPKEEAEKTGALAFFRQKYPDIVKVYSIGDISKEFCAGPHVKNTGEIGTFKILKEESVSAGLRRIKATIT
ncbi:MAG: alanine--tRNA ligase [Candidatus Paceibacterota bacterium]|jgi:alanyl-tRNA synthetase